MHFFCQWSKFMTLISNKCFIKCAAVSNKSNNYIKDNIWFLNQTLRHSAFLATKLFFFPWDVPVLLWGHYHLIHLQLEPSSTQAAALSWHLYPCGDGGVRSSWVECWEVVTLDFLGGQPVAKMIVLMDSFLHDPSQLSKKKEEPPESQSTFSCSLSQIWCS